MLLLRSFVYAVGFYTLANPPRHWPCQQCLCNLWIRIRTVLLKNLSRMTRWEFCRTITHIKGLGHVPFSTVGVPAPCAHAMMRTNPYCLGRATPLQHSTGLSGHCATEYRYQNMLYCNKLRSEVAGKKLHVGVCGRHFFTKHTTTQILLPVGDSQVNCSTSSDLNSHLTQTKECHIICFSSNLIRSKASGLTNRCPR